MKRSAPWIYGARFLGNHCIHPHVVWLRVGVRDELEVEANAKFEGTRTGTSQHAVVKATATAEAVAHGSEGEAGAEEDVNLADRNFR